MATERDELAQQMCEIGRRLYERGHVAGTEGNLSARLTEQEFLCTPSLSCKGFLTPEDLCVVDEAGALRQGARPRTSEMLLHLEVYRHDATAGAVVHTHPPHVTAFAVTHVPIPTGLVPETELFFGEVPMAPYETPATQAFAETVRPFIGRTRSVVLANHGLVTWGPTLESAWRLTDMLDAYCRMILLARPLGQLQSLPPGKRDELRAAAAGFR